MEITLKDLLGWMMKGIVFILVAAVLFGTGAFIYTKYFIEPTYTAQVKFFAAAAETNVYSSSNQSVAPQFVEFLNINEFDELVSKDLAETTGLNLSPKEIASCLSFSSVIEETSSFFVVITTTDPTLTYSIALSVAEMAPRQIANYENIGTLTVLSNPVMPTAPSGPNAVRNTFVGFVFGFILAAAIIILRELTDNRIRSAEELTEIFGLPLFGIVPDFSSNEKKGVH